MQNFVYHTPTKLYFGKNAIENLPAIMAPLGKKVLLTYGGGSIKRMGLYDTVLKLLEGCEVYELSGIEPNPKYDPSVLEGVRICKEKGVDVVLAVGGGSVLDCSKAICGGACYDGDPWDLITDKAETRAALPLVTVLTLSATGSEYDNGCVISRTETNDKTSYISPLLYPVASIMDPTYTFSVSRRQTSAGGADAINHVMEQFLVAEGNDITDGLCEATIKSLRKNTAIALEHPDDYTARAELMLACTLGCNGILGIGNTFSGWPCHSIEHALSAYYDITHGEGLAIITPRWMQHILGEKTRDRIAAFGVRIFDLDPSLPVDELAQTAIDKTYDMYAALGCPMHLKDVGIDESRLDEIAHHIAVNEGLEYAWAPLTEQDILEILQASL